MIPTIKYAPILAVIAVGLVIALCVVPEERRLTPAATATPSGEFLLAEKKPSGIAMINVRSDVAVVFGASLVL
jgi:hypothetical protein